MNRAVLRSEIVATESGFVSAAAAFLSLAKSQRRIAGQYRQWAREAEAEGNATHYQRYAPMARETFRAAKEHLSQARHYRDLAERKF